MKQLRKFLTSATFWEHVLPILFLNGGVFYTLPHIYPKLLAQGHNPVTLFFGVVLAIVLINFYYLFIHFIGLFAAGSLSPAGMKGCALNHSYSKLFTTLHSSRHPSSTPQPKIAQDHTSKKTQQLQRTGRLDVLRSRTRR